MNAVLRFDFADALGLPSPVRFADPERVIVAHTLAEVGQAMADVEAATRDGWYAAGYVAYEAARAFDDALETQPAGRMPLVWFGLFRAPQSSAEPRPAAGESTGMPAAAANGTGAALTASLTSAIAPTDMPAASAALTWTPDITREAYCQGIDAVKAAIARGDTYQVNYTFRLRAAFAADARDDTAPATPGAHVAPAPDATLATDGRRAADATYSAPGTPAAHAGHPVGPVDDAPRREARSEAGRAPASAPAPPTDLDALYDDLVRTHRAPYAASLDLGRWRVLSLSPELFLRVGGRRIVTRPMKGTAARASWLEEDDGRGAWLASSEKNRAENVMIVDLARNDVGRVAAVGSVQATRLFEVERHPSVWQMVSTVEGTLRPEATLVDLFTALFPAGSITGAPKSSSMRLIASIEAAPRGVYCGAIGFVTPAGEAIFSVAIRTAVFDCETGQAEYGVGGGITWDSTAADEYAEALSKAAALTATPPFELLETMRLDEQGYARRARHLARLRESAAYWDIPFDAAAIDAALDVHARAHGRTGSAVTPPHRVRLTLSRSGEPRIESTPLHAAHEDAAEPETAAPDAAAPRLVALAKTPVSRADRFLFHKTTNRAVYEAHKAARPELFDVLLWNEAREITEFTIGNIVVEIDGVRWTPPRHCGLLAGTLRAELLDAGTIRERVLTIDDLATVTRIWLINSVREWVPVELTA